VLQKAKREQDASVNEFLFKMEKLASGCRDVIESICDEDADKHPREFGAEPPPPPPRSTKKKKSSIGRARAASVKWFKEEQKDQLTDDDGGFADWFHGIISREQAADLLHGQPSGTFLIRVAESRFGYSLSLTIDGQFHDQPQDPLA
jgi:myosin-3